MFTDGACMFGEAVYHQHTSSCSMSIKCYMVKTVYLRPDPQSGLSETILLNPDKDSLNYHSFKRVISSHFISSISDQSSP